ncbi:MAG: acyltransferase [Pseudomonadota bacterium]
MKATEYLSATELQNLGLASCGRHVFISREATICYPDQVHIGSRVRIDAFSLLIAKAPIAIGNHVHIGSSVTINAAAEVVIGDYSGLSAGTKIFTTDDDYSGAYLTGPTVDPELTNVVTAPVRLADHCIVGANSVILPGTTLGQGVAVGALSLVKGNLPEWGVYAGVPAKLLKPRSRELLGRLEAMTASSLASAE